MRPGQKSWYTHHRLRKAYVLLERCAKHQELFTYLEPGFDFEVASTTNRIEGSINAQLRLLLRHHRGLPEGHMRRAVEWFLYLRSEHPKASHQLIEERHYRASPRAPHRLQKSSDPSSTRKPLLLRKDSGTGLVGQARASKPAGQPNPAPRYNPKRTR